MNWQLTGLKLSAAALLSVVGVDSSHSLGAPPCGYEVSRVLVGPMCAGAPAPLTGLGISPNGEFICGYWSDCFAYERAFYYRVSTSQLTTLSFPPGFYRTWAAAVNDDGLIVGGGESTGLGQQAWVYTIASSQYQLIDSGKSGVFTSASGVNAKGTVCGYTPGLPQHGPFAWSVDEGYVELPVRLEDGSASGITNSGRVFGTGGGLALPTQRGFVWEQGSATIVAPIPGDITSSVVGINDNDVMLLNGASQLNPTIGRAYLDDGTVHILQPLPGFDSSGGSALTNDGLVVGSSLKSGTALRRATLWRDGMPIDLQNSLGPNNPYTLLQTKAISDTGTIVVTAWTMTSTMTLALVPRPATPGDSNCDAVCNIDDLINVINHWGPCHGCTADFDSNALVDVNDLLVVVNNWTVSP